MLTIKVYRVKAGGEREHVRTTEVSGDKADIASLSFGLPPCECSKATGRPCPEQSARRR